MAICHNLISLVVDRDSFANMNTFSKNFSFYNIAQDIEIILEDSTDDRSLEKWFQDDGSAFPSENPPNFNFDDVVLLPYSSGK